MRRRFQIKEKHKSLHAKNNCEQFGTLFLKKTVIITFFVIFLLNTSFLLWMNSLDSLLLMWCHLQVFIVPNLHYLNIFLSLGCP